MSEQEFKSQKRDLKIAENEASRERASDARLATWAIGVTVIIVAVILVFFLKK